MHWSQVMRGSYPMCFEVRFLALLIRNVLKWMPECPKRASRITTRHQEKSSFFQILNQLHLWDICGEKSSPLKYPQMNIRFDTDTHVRKPPSPPYSSPTSPIATFVTWPSRQSHLHGDLTRWLEAGGASDKLHLPHLPGRPEGDITYLSILCIIPWK